MNYNDYNRPQEPWENNIERGADPVYSAPEPPRKKGGGGARLVAVALVCALVGGFAGGGLTYWMGNRGGSTTLTQGTRTPTVVNVSQTTSQTPLTAAQIYNKYVGSTVGITTEITTNAWGQTVSRAAAGSGFVISADGYILTNYHVVDGANSIKVTFVDDASYDAVLVGGEESNDIAVLKIEATGLTPVVIGDSDTLQVGEWVGAIGNPLGELTFSMTQGSVSAKDRSLTMSDGTVMNMIQTDTAINSGNSGGPLFDSYGQVIGITSAKLSNNNSSSEATIEGLGFAIPINDVKDMVQDIIEHGYVTGKPYLGITVKTIPEAVAKEYNIAQGAQVQSVDSASCTAKAGLQVGDIITGIDDAAVTSSAELIEALKEYKAGATASLAVNRNGVLLNLDVTFDEDTPERREAQQRQQEEAEQRALQEQQQQQQNGNVFSWPFGNMNPWFY